MSKNREVDKGLKGLGNQLMGTVKQATSMRVRVSCKSCGGYKGLFDSSSCPHPGADDGQTFEHDVTITTVASEEREPVERIERQPEKKISSRFKDPIAEEKMNEPEVGAKVRTDGGKSRRDYTTLKGDKDPFVRAQQQHIVDYEPGIGGRDDLDKLEEETPNVPRYGLDPR